MFESREHVRLLSFSPSPSLPLSLYLPLCILHGVSVSVSVYVHVCFTGSLARLPHLLSEPPHALAMLERRGVRVCFDACVVQAALGEAC